MSRDASVVRDADGLCRLIDTLSAASVSAVATRAGVEDAALTVTARALPPPRSPARRAAAATTGRTTPTQVQLPRAVWSSGWPPTATRRWRRWRRFPDGHRASDDAEPSDGEERRHAVGKRTRGGSRHDPPRLAEDLRYGPDVTTRATVPAGTRTTASLVTREPGVIAGLDVALLVLDEVLGADEYRVLHRVEDGARLPAGAPLLTVEAQTLGLLTAERTPLNLVCHLSGVATATAAWVDAVRGHQAPDPRHPQDAARPAAAAEVRGARRRRRQPPARPRRRGADQGQPRRRGGIGRRGAAAVRAAAPDLPCEVEVDSLDQLDEVLADGAELVLLDNFTVWQTPTRSGGARRGAGRPNWSPPAGFRWRTPPSTPGPASTSSRSARSPIRSGRSTSAWTSRLGEQNAECGS